MTSAILVSTRSTRVQLAAIDTIKKLVISQPNQVHDMFDCRTILYVLHSLHCIVCVTLTILYCMCYIGYTVLYVLHSLHYIVCVTLATLYCMCYIHYTVEYCRLPKYCYFDTLE